MAYCAVNFGHMIAINVKIIRSDRDAKAYKSR